MTKDPAALPRMLTSREVERALGVSRPTLRALVDRGELAATKVGAQYRYWPADVEAFLDANRVAPPRRVLTLLDLDVIDVDEEVSRHGLL